MKQRIFCFGLALALLLSGCGKHTTPVPTPTHTTATTNASTTTASSASFTTAATPSETTVNTTTNPTSTNTTDAPTATTLGIQTSTPTMNSTTDTTTSTSSTDTHTTSTTVSTTAPYTETVFKATVRDHINNRPVSGVVVTVWISLDYQIGSATTDKDGVALITVPKRSAYRVTLTLPQGYEAEPEYRFATTTVNITIRKSAVQNELDHSQAQYGVGKTMTDFSLNDTDGNTYRLSELLKEKKLVILDFWYTTCEPCKLEFPFFEAAIQKYGDDMALLAIDPIDSLRAITALRNQLNAKPSTAVSFPMLKDTCNLSLGFDVTTYPVTVFIDSNGRIMEIHDGAFMSQSDFLATIQKYLD